MPLQATSGAASYDAFGGGVAAVPNYIEEVFASHLYTGNGSTQTITNGIDLAGKGGLVWTKSRSLADPAFIYDTSRGVNNFLIPSSTQAAAPTSRALTAFNSNGFTLGDNDFSNDNIGETSVSWTFRKQPKFFDVVTYTGTGSVQNVAHSLGSVPGCIIVKRINDTQNWRVYHRSLGSGLYINLDQTDAASNAGAAFMWNNTDPTSTVFTVNSNSSVNASGSTYVAYLFAHNAGGFGLTGTDNVISCGSFTAASNSATVNLGYEPQWILWKQSDASANWYIYDTMRGWSYSVTNGLFPNTSGAEVNDGGTSSVFFVPTATGFEIKNFVNNGTYIYIAIRRGPMRTPTVGTSVFDAGTRSGSGSVAKTNSNILTDLTFIKNRTSGGEYWAWTPRLTGNLTLQSNSTDPELTGAMATNPWDTMTGAFCAASNGATNSGSLIDYSFRRAPGFHDVVCYTGTGSATTFTHNLGVAPELIIVKGRSDTGGSNWCVYSAPTSAGGFLRLNGTSAYSASSTQWNNTAPTSTQFTLGTRVDSNSSGQTYVAYLFASVPGVQSIQSFVGDGTTGRTINCGFTGGARFVCIKATSTTGSWWTFDSARGIVTNNDPALQLNSTAAEVTSADAIDTAASGFIVNQEATCSLNASGVTYLVWAIA